LAARYRRIKENIFFSKELYIYIYIYIYIYSKEGERGNIWWSIGIGPRGLCYLLKSFENFGRIRGNKGTSNAKSHLFIFLIVILKVTLIL
jgi:hypothetical protein